MTMATETSQPQDARGTSKGGVLCKQSEIEEDEQDTSPGSDQSDATITAGEKEVHVQGGGSPEFVQPDSFPVEESNLSNNTQGVTQKLKQLQRSKAIEESPSPDPQTLIPEASTNGVILNNYSQSSSKEKLLQKCGSQSSEAGSSCLSRDSSFDSTPYKDSTGINLEDFIHKTINKSPKDRNMLLKLETDLVNFINEPKHHYLKFPQMSSYDRMLVHRIAAYFGLDHNVDQTGKCVIVNKTSNKRIPDFSFKEHIDNLDSSTVKVKSIIQRENKSLDEREIYFPRNLDKPSLGNMKARSFEERRKRYEKVRSKIFSSADGDPTQEPVAFAEDEVPIGIPNIKKPQRPSSISKTSEGQPWSSTDSSGYGTDCSTRSKSIPKANSFGGVTHNHHIRNTNKSMSLSKADSLNSGTASPGMQRHFVTPPGSRSGSSPLSCSSSTGPVQSPIQPAFPPASGSALWVASDYRNIPPGSIIINPQTGQPFSNPDGSVYTFNPNIPIPNGQQPVVCSQPQYQPEGWTPNQDAVTGSEQLCRHLSMMSLSQQSSMESVGDMPGQGPPGGVQYIVGGQNQVTSVNLPQQPNQQFYPGPQSVNGQPNIRYVYPINYQTQCQHQVSTETQNQNSFSSGTCAPQQYANHIGQGYSSYPVVASQNVDNVMNFSQTSFPVAHNESNMTFPVSYPVQYNSGQNTPQVFYSNTPNVQQGVTGYTYNQGPYQTSPPSQQPSHLPSANGHMQTIPQAGSVPLTGNIQTPTTSQYVYPSLSQFQGQPRVGNPQIVQYQNMPPQHTVNPASNSAQSVNLMRNLQMNIPVPSIPGVVTQPQTVPLQPSGPVTVSAKGFSVENTLPKFDSDKPDYILGGIGSLASPVLGAPRTLGQVLRPQIPADVLLGQTCLQLPLQPVIHQQKPRMSNQQNNKQQRLKKSRSKEGSESSSSQSFECESPSVEYLEVVDLPLNLSKSETEEILADLISQGVQIEFQDSDSGSQTVLAILPSNLSAADLIKTHKNSNYKLRLCNSDDIQ